LSQQTLEQKIALIRDDLERYKNGALTSMEKKLVTALKRRLKELESKK
jgi:hypothetical protein